MRLRHAPVVFIVVDPVQDWEESLEVWSVHGSLAAAKIGVRRGRAKRYGGPLSYLAQRYTEVQRWMGHQCTDVWTYDTTGRWTHRPGSA